MRRAMMILVGATIAFRVIAGPELTGTPDELTAYLRSLPGQVTLSAEAELKVEADRAEVVLKVCNTDRSFKNALAHNQQMRADILATLERNGLPADRIQMSRFSSTPTQGTFSSKVKAYEVESTVTIQATSEKEVLAIAALVDERDGVTLLSLTFRDSQKDANTLQVVQRALAKVNGLKAMYESQLGIGLVARAVGTQPAHPGTSLTRRRVYAGSEVSGSSSTFSLSEGPRIRHALEPEDPALSQFDQVVYTVTVTVTFDVINHD